MGSVASGASKLFSSKGGAALLGGIAGGLLSKSKKEAVAPEVKPPTPMPDPLEQQKARERSIIEQMTRRGRSASILTDGGTLGG
jgi:hypothetical protein